MIVPYICYVNQLNTSNKQKSLDVAKFKQSVLEIMKSDPDLFAKLAKAMDIEPASLPMTIKRNGNNLNQYSIVTLVASHLKRNPKDLLEQDTVKEGA